MSQKTEIIIGVNAWTDAQRKARYGRRDWVAWTGKDGGRRAAPKTAKAIKMAMLATGTQDRFRMYCAHDGALACVNWSIAALMYRIARGAERRGE